MKTKSLIATNSYLQDAAARQEQLEKNTLASSAFEGARGLGTRTLSIGALRSVRDRSSLFDFLHRSLGWEVRAEDTFTYDVPLPEGVTELADVTQIVPFSEGDPFLIMLAEFKASFRRTQLRKILQGIRAQMRQSGRYAGKQTDEIIFVCPTDDYRGVSFAHFEERDDHTPKLRVFGWNAAQLDATRTLRDINLPALRMPKTNLLDEPDWAEGRKRWLSAWDVETVTRQFFQDYRQVFASVELAVTQVSGDKRLFTQRLLNRLLFIQFLSKKNWLRFGDDPHKDYLQALWEAHDPDTNFYNTRLRPLFASALNNPFCSTLPKTNPTLHSLIGDVPYLNGGLFEAAPEEGKNEQVADTAIEAVLHLFQQYNFTIDESTPDDVEVAVDPEMLGKVFEELVVGRHESGSYYTPRPIVSFMCRAALKGYLGGGPAVTRFVDAGDATDLTDPEAVLAALKAVQVCDPACGSGAYLLGMMQELLRLREALFVAKAKDYKKIYDRKLEIIERNLYGVDKDQFAVNIAMLRLWLSLVVDDHRHPLDESLPKAQRDVSLPNLKFKIQVGDALAAPAPDAGALTLHAAEYAADAQALAALYRDYYTPAHAGQAQRKAALETAITEKRAQIADLLGTDDNPGVVDWRIAFAEVFAPKEPVADLGGAMNFGGTLAEPAQPGGFDIVLANPPYVRQELIKEQKPTLKAVFPEVYVGTADLYCYFYARSVQLLRSGGMLAFISPNKWFRAGYGAKLKAYLAAQSHVVSITDFGDLPVFQSATTYPMIFVAQKGVTEGTTTFTQVKSLESPYPDVRRLIEQEGSVLPSDAIQGADWHLADTATTDRLRKMQKMGIALGEYVKGQIYYGIKTGLGSAFTITETEHKEILASNPEAAEVLKPLAVGKDIRKWAIRDNKKWLIVTRMGEKIDRYPAILNHLKQWQAELETRSDQGDFWWELRACTYYEVFDKPKIIYQRFQVKPCFCYDINKVYVNDATYMVSTNDLYLLGVMNSQPFWQEVKRNCPFIQNGYQLLRSNFERCLVPNASDTDRIAIFALVQKCLDAKGVGCEEWEQEIDGRVAALYGL